MICTIIHVGGTVDPGEPWRAVAGVVGEVILALPAVRARVTVHIAEGDLGLAVFTLVAGLTTAVIVADFVHTGGVVLTKVADTVVYIHLTAHTFKSFGALTSAIYRQH